MARKSDWHMESLKVGAIVYRERTKAACKLAHQSHVNRLFAEADTRPIMLRSREGRIMIGWFNTAAGQWEIEYQDPTERDNSRISSWSTGYATRESTERMMRRHMADIETDPTWMRESDEEGIALYHRTQAGRAEMMEEWNRKEALAGR